MTLMLASVTGPQSNPWGSSRRAIDGESPAVRAHLASGNLMPLFWLVHDMQAVIESVVRAMVNARIAGADDSSEDSVSDRMPVLIDAEARLRLGDD